MAAVQAKNWDLQARLDAQLTEQRYNDTFQQLSAQAEAVKAQFPGFELEVELAETPKFGDLVRSGIDMLTAYQVCHQADMLQAAQKTGETRTANAVRSNQARLAENGTGNSPAAKLGADPSKWTKAQFRKFSQLPKALTPLTEGVTPDGGSLAVTSDTATVSQ